MIHDNTMVVLKQVFTLLDNGHWFYIVLPISSAMLWHAEYAWT